MKLLNGLIKENNMKKPNPFKLNINSDIDKNMSVQQEVKKETPKSKEINQDIKGLFTKKEKEKKIITTIYITEKLSKKLNALSKENDISVNEVVTTILENALQ